MPIEGRGRYLDPKQIPPRDRDIHLVVCSDMNLQQTLGKAHNQHLPLIQRLRTRILRGISQDNKVTLHISYYTPWSQGHNLQSVHYNSSTKPGHFSAQSTTSYCTTLPCNKKLKQDHKNKTKYKSTTTTVIMGDLMGVLLVERLASKGLDAGGSHG